MITTNNGEGNEEAKDETTNVLKQRIDECKIQTRQSVQRKVTESNSDADARADHSKKANPEDQAEVPVRRILKPKRTLATSVVDEFEKM